VWNDHTYPVTEKIHEQELSIPMNQVVTTDQALEVVRLLNSFK
jgi:dTDP-4-amino-4,6-dideoxygalactose transaminase